MLRNSLIISVVAFGFVLSTVSHSHAALPTVEDVNAQPLLHQVKRLQEAMDYLGEPFSKETIALLDKAQKAKGQDAVALVQKALDPYCLYGVHINPESRVKVAQGDAKPILAQNGWRQFLVKVHNEAGVTAPLAASSPQAFPVHDGHIFGQRRSDRRPAGNHPPTPTKDNVRDRWLDLQTFDKQPLPTKLSGLKLEYRVIQLYSRDAGKRSAAVAFDVGQGTQDIGFRNDVTITFTAKQSVPVTLRVKDENGKPTTAAFEIRDQVGRVYPSQAKRLAPDFGFHPQIYRHDGEKVNLPAGKYNVRVMRGPEYYPMSKTLTITRGQEDAEFALQLKRWVDPAALGWWSGDHHIHAAGCQHYNNPSQGVHAPDMLRHCLGEDLKVGANLTWGPCFDYQKQFFTGKVDKVSKYPYLLRYDVEVSGFGSHRSGHLCLLRLKSQIPPGGDSKNHWPTLCLNTLKWAKKQGAVVGPAHSGWGLFVPGNELPNWNVPPFNGIGACEYIVDVTHMVDGPKGEKVPAVDFISTVDTPYVWELNIWYHTLNVGYRTRISGETDFPCIYGERVGLGRSYIKLDGKLDYDAWCEGIRQGRCYTGDGRSHIMDMKVTEKLTVEARRPISVNLGENGSEISLDKAGEVTVTAKVAALLPEKTTAATKRIQNANYTQKPYWHIERARIGDTRKVPVELIVNGRPVARQEIPADGKTRDITFNTKIDRSSWITMRVLPSSHTNPIWVMVDGKPVRASKRSAEWCLKSVQQCRKEKLKFIDADEIKDFHAAYDHAEATYRKIIAEFGAD